MLLRSEIKLTQKYEFSIQIHYPIHSSDDFKPICTQQFWIKDFRIILIGVCSPVVRAEPNAGEANLLLHWANPVALAANGRQTTWRGDAA